MEKKYILAVDLGGTGTRALVFDRSLKLVAQDYSQLEAIHSGPDEVDINPEKMWDKIVTTMRNAVAKAGIDAGEIDMGHIDLVYTMTPKTDDFTEIQGWIPYVDLRSGEALRMVFRFMPDHTGTIYNFSWEDGQDFTWAVDKDGSAVITMGDGTQYPVTFYKLKNDEQGIDQTWICVEMDGYFYWTHIAQGDI